MPELSTIAAVDLGLGAFGSGMTCSSKAADARPSMIGGEAGTADWINWGRLASAERAQAQPDRGRVTANV